MSPKQHQARLPVHLSVLLAAILSGFLLLLVVHITFSELISDLDKRTGNEANRLAIGDSIVQEIGLVEAGVYKLATTRNTIGRKLQHKQIDQHLQNLAQMLSVLEKGGSIDKVTHLNIANRDKMVRTIHYTPASDETKFVLEVIDLAPKLHQVAGKIDQLDDVLKQREAMFAGGNADDMRLVENRILNFIKTLPPLFFRMKENASRMFFESSQE